MEGHEELRRHRRRGRRIPVQYGPLDRGKIPDAGGCLGSDPEAGWSADVLAAESRIEAGPTAPPQGLFLIRVCYAVAPNYKMITYYINKRSIYFKKFN